MAVGLFNSQELRILAVLAVQGETLARIELALATATKMEIKHMAAIDDAIASLTSQVETNTTVEGSALALINGFSAQLAAAIAAAVAAGATQAQLAALAALNTSVKASDDELAAAVAKNTAA